MNRMLPISAALVVGFALGAVTLCQIKGPQIMWMEVQPGGKVYAAPKPGDIIRWVDKKGEAVPVSFSPRKSPCVTDNTAECVIRADAKNKYFKYKCASCEDPGLAVGSDENKRWERLTGSGVAAVPDNDPHIYCDAAGKATVDDAEAHIGQNITWTGDDIVATFKVYGFSGIILPCDKAEYNQDNPVCKATNAVSVTYKIRADACVTQPESEGKLTVKP